MKTINDLRDQYPNTCIVVEKMCEYVGADHNTLDFERPMWFFEYQWSDETQEEFKQWLIEFLKNRSAMREFTTYSSVSKKMRESTANAIIFNFGWKSSNLTPVRPDEENISN